MLPSEIPKPSQTRQWEGFLVFGNFSFTTPSLGWVSIPNSFVSFCLLHFFLPPFEGNGLPFWVPGVLCQHSEVVLWNLLSIQMIFWWICGEESGLPILFLHHLSPLQPCFGFLTATYVGSWIPNQGSNPHSLHWTLKFLPLDNEGSPRWKNSEGWRGREKEWAKRPWCMLDTYERRREGRLDEKSLIR